MSFWYYFLVLALSIASVLAYLIGYQHGVKVGQTIGVRDPHLDDYEAVGIASVIIAEAFDPLLEDQFLTEFTPGVAGSAIFNKHEADQLGCKMTIDHRHNWVRRFDLTQDDDVEICANCGMKCRFSG